MFSQEPISLNEAYNSLILKNEQNQIITNDNRRSYTPEDIETNRLIIESKMTNNSDYRKYMIQNSKQIIEKNRKEAQDNIGYIKRYSNKKYESYPRNTQIDLGYSDLKQMYLTKEELNTKLMNPDITQYEILRQKS
jgi:hypothetical protein